MSSTWQDYPAPHTEGRPCDCPPCEWARDDYNPALTFRGIFYGLIGTLVLYGTFVLGALLCRLVGISPW